MIDNTNAFRILTAEPVTSVLLKSKSIAKRDAGNEAVLITEEELEPFVAQGVDGIWGQVQYLGRLSLARQGRSPRARV